MKADFPVVVLDDNGNPTSTKSRKDVDREKDFLHTVHVFVFNKNKNLFLSTILSKTEIPEIFRNKFGSTAATLVEENESAEDAARRALKNELYSDLPLTLLGEEIDTVDSNIKRKHSVFYAISESELLDFNPEKIASLEPITRQSLESLIDADPSKFASTFLVIYERYRKELPF